MCESLHLAYLLVAKTDRAFLKSNPSSNGLLPLPLSRHLFESVVQKFELSSDFLASHGTGRIAYSGPSENDLEDDDEKCLNARWSPIRTHPPAAKADRSARLHLSDEQVPVLLLDGIEFRHRNGQDMHIVTWY